MKNILFSIAIILSLFSCNKKDEAPTPAQNVQAIDNIHTSRYKVTIQANITDYYLYTIKASEVFIREGKEMKQHSITTINKYEFYIETAKGNHITIECDSRDYSLTITRELKQVYFRDNINKESYSFISN